MNRKFIYYMESFVDELQNMVDSNPIALVPFGALEWHGEHNVVGVDSIKSTEIIKRVAERIGGVVFPCVNWGAFTTMKFPFTFHFSKRSLKKMTKRMVKQLYGMGFKIIVLITGHYPMGQIRQVKHAAKRISRKHSDCFALGIPEQAIVADLGYLGDHAAMWETSMMMAIVPNRVNIQKIPKNLSFPERCIRHGVMGKDPTELASAEKGKNILHEIVFRLSEAILEVQTTQSIKPFNAIYERYSNSMKNLRKLDNLFVNNGIKTKKEGLEYVKWVLFHNMKYNPDYQ